MQLVESLKALFCHLTKVANEFVIADELMGFVVSKKPTVSTDELFVLNAN